MCVDKPDRTKQKNEQKDAHFERIYKQHYVLLCFPLLVNASKYPRIST